LRRCEFPLERAEAFFRFVEKAKAASTRYRTQPGSRQE
jgi:hypothetical protein